MSTALLSVEGLCLRAGDADLVRDVSFTIEPGAFLGVVGESGSGKTMVARAVMRLLPDGIHQTAGRIRLDGQDLSKLPAAALRRLRGAAIGMVFQEPMVSLNPAMTVGAQMIEGLRLHHRLPHSEMRARAVEMLRMVQIRDPEGAMRNYPHTFSGGMRQRIMLASVMLLRPRLLIADEPTTALDMLSQREVLDLMVALARDQGTAVMLITHNLGLVGRYAQRAIVMRGTRCGKTTLGRAVLGLLLKSAGRIVVGGVDLDGADPAQRREARLACQLIFQDPYSSLDPRMRIVDIVAEPLRHAPDIRPADRRLRVAEILDQVGLGALGGRFPHELSGGQRQRVAIARAIIRKPAFVVADEPVSALDMTIQRQVLTLFRALQAEYGFAGLFISHDLGAVEQIADRILVMQAGHLVEQGTVEQVLGQPSHPYTRALLDAMPQGPAQTEGRR
jgi:ABC-type glutathione transport system ATPase component